MADILVSKFEDLHRASQSYGTQTVSYRGLSKISHELVPKIGRYKVFKDSGDTLKEEKTMLRLLKQQAIRFIHFTPANDWEWLAIAQHHGIPTRLMDWITPHDASLAPSIGSSAEC